MIQRKSLETDYGFWRSGELSDAIMATRFFIYYHLNKYPNKKIQSAFDSGLAEDVILSSYVFKKVRPKVISALLNWLNRRWEVKLFDRILSPYEVLDLQASGIRPVTMKLQDTLSPILHKDDCLEFLVHDLEHAYMFFHNDELKFMQIDFFNNIKKSLEMKFWDKYLDRPEFRERFYYLISDMNTHREHYKAYLLSMLDPSDIEICQQFFAPSTELTI